MDLTNKVAVITGSSRGIGKVIAQRMAQAGADVVVNCRNTVDRAEETAAEIRKGGRRALVVQADVGERAEAENLVSAALQEFGQIDIFVNNAGIIIDRPLVDSTDEDWERAMHSMLDAVFYATRAVLPHMIDRKYGRVLAQGSIITDKFQFAGNKMSVCTAAKAGIVTMLRAVAAEVAEHGITVNCVAPGIVATEMMHDIDAEALAPVVDMIPMGRFGEPEEIADAMVFLASGLAGYITGQTLRVNGGMSMF